MRAQLWYRCRLCRCWLGVLSSCLIYPGCCSCRLVTLREVYTPTAMTGFTECVAWNFTTLFCDGNRPEIMSQVLIWHFCVFGKAIKPSMGQYECLTGAGQIPTASGAPVSDWLTDWDQLIHLKLQGFYLKVTFLFFCTFSHDVLFCLINDDPDTGFKFFLSLSLSGVSTSVSMKQVLLVFSESLHLLVWPLVGMNRCFPLCTGPVLFISSVQIKDLIKSEGIFAGR